MLTTVPWSMSTSSGLILWRVSVHLPSPFVDSCSRSAGKLTIKGGSWPLNKIKDKNVQEGRGNKPKIANRQRKTKVNGSQWEEGGRPACVASNCGVGRRLRACERARLQMEKQANVTSGQWDERSLGAYLHPLSLSRSTPLHCSPLDRTLADELAKLISLAKRTTDWSHQLRSSRVWCGGIYTVWRWPHST